MSDDFRGAEMKMKNADPNLTDKISPLQNTEPENVDQIANVENDGTRNTASIF